MSDFNQATTENRDRRLLANVKNEAKRKRDSSDSITSDPERLDKTMVNANIQNKDIKPGIKTILISAYKQNDSHGKAHWPPIRGIA